MKRYVSAALLAVLLLSACGSPGGGSNQPGTAWAPGSFGSNGEQIYFTSIDSHGNRIAYTGGPALGGMMMGGYLACASCHGPDGRGGVHVMHMETMDAPDIRWPALAAMAAKDRGLPGGQGNYDLATFRQAVVEGQDAAGQSLDDDMPRWQMDDQDLADLAAYLQLLP
jgi:cytochrome c oxidase subunit II